MGVWGKLRNAKVFTKADVKNPIYPLNNKYIEKTKKYEKKYENQNQK